MQINFEKYLTPQIITLLTVFGILSILIIVSIFLLVIFRKSSFVQKIIWNLKEWRNLLSNQPSYYSQKRIKSSVAFYSAEGLIIIYDFVHLHIMSATEIGAHAIILFGIAGYHLKKTQEEKLSDESDVDDPIPVGSGSSSTVTVDVNTSTSPDPSSPPPDMTPTH